MCGMNRQSNEGEFEPTLITVGTYHLLQHSLSSGIIFSNRTEIETQVVKKCRNIYKPAISLKLAHTIEDLVRREEIQFA